MYRVSTQHCVNTFYTTWYLLFLFICLECQNAISELHQVVPSTKMYVATSHLSSVSTTHLFPG